jgi:hypothetical protein
MNDPKAQPMAGDELDLDAEAIEDLEPDEEDANAVRGGPGTSGYSACLNWRPG